MEKKILIRREKEAEVKFLKTLGDTVKTGNNLIKLLNSSQFFLRIETREQAEKLISDPLAFYDQLLIDNISHDSRLNVNMVALSELYNIPRKMFLMGLGVPEDQTSSCQTCGERPVGGTTRISLKDEAIIDAAQFENFSEFLLFRDGVFEIDNKAVEEYSDNFNIYVSNASQFELYNHYNNLADILNDAVAYHKLSSANVQELSKMFGFLILDGKLIINDIKIAEIIKYMN